LALGPLVLAPIHQRGSARVDGDDIISQLREAGERLEDVTQRQQAALVELRGALPPQSRGSTMAAAAPRRLETLQVLTGPPPSGRSDGLSPPLSPASSVVPSTTLRLKGGQLGTTSVEACASGTSRLRVAHFVNFMPRDTTHHADQRVTIASMIRAFDVARREPKGPCVEMHTLGYDDEWGRRVPRDESLFRRTRGLVSEAYDVYELDKLDVREPRKRLPLMSELLGIMYESTAADVVVFTNADIGVQPDFYLKVEKHLQYNGPSSAPRSMSINRVEIPESNLGVDNLDTILHLGKQKRQNHAGHDCFVFERRSIPFLQLYLRGIFVGYPPVGSKLVDAMNCVSRYRLISGKHITFHLGVKNGGWGTWSAFEYYNRKVAKHSLKLFHQALGGRSSKEACAPIRNAKGASGQALVTRAMDEYLRRPVAKPNVPPPSPPQSLRHAGVPSAPTVGPSPRTTSTRSLEPEPSHTIEPLRHTSRCLAPSQARPRSQVRKLVIASSGRVGSTMLAEILGRHGIRVEHSHLSASEIEERERNKSKPTPVLYIFADPIDVILSLRQRDLDTGDSFFGKGISWVQRHLENMNIPESKFGAWQRGEYFEQDVLDLAGHFEDWHRPHAFPMMSLRYETERQNMELLATFLGLPVARVSLPPAHAKVKGSRGKVPRTERFKRLHLDQQQQLNATYGALRERTKASPDACVWRMLQHNPASAGAGAAAGH